MIKFVMQRLGVARAAFASGVAIPLMMAVSVYAQATADTPAPQPAAQAGTTAEAERVIVTGSNIPTAEEVGPNPVLSLNRDLIQKSGERNTEQLLKNQPVANSNSVPSANNATSQGGPAGATSVSLRGFDVSATLVLIDGRRITPFPATNFFDLNTIPLPAIESIEILKDGASATYGADAVAGVVNIKLWKDYRGVQTSVEYGNTLDKDAAIFRADVLFGIGDDKTQVTGDIFYYHHNSMFNRDRGNSAVPPFLSSNASPLNLQVSSDVAAAAGGQNLVPGGIEFTTAPDFTNGLVPASAYIYDVRRVRGPGSQLPGFNFNQFSGSFPESERWGGYTAFRHKVCDDQLVIYGDMYYADVKQHDELAPIATGSFQTKGQGTLAIPPNHILPGGITPPNTPTFDETGVPLDAFNPFNPFEQIISGGSRARLAEFGNRLIDNESDAFLTTLGLKGDKLFDGNWGYDAGFRYSQIKTRAQIQTVSVSRFNRILNANDPIFDPTSDQFIGTTIPYNPFGDFRNPIAANQPSINFATIRPRDLTVSKLTELDLNIYTTELFKLPGGPVGFAFGGQFRRENLVFDPDDLNRVKDQAGVGQEFATQGGRKDYAFYGEMLIPLTSPEMKIPGLHSLEFTASGRFEAFENNDTNVLVPKVGLRWQPFDEELTIRSTWGEGFLEPSLSQLNAGPIFILAPTTFMGSAEPETTTEIDSNPNLQPEDSRSWSGGIVYTPKWIPAGTLTLSVDLWDIERTGVVIPPSPQNVVDRFQTGELRPGESVQLDPSGTTVNFVQTNFQNSGRENARGVDFGLQYQVQTPYVTFTSLTQATYLDSFIFQFPGEIAREAAGRANNDPFEGAFFGQVTGGDGWYKWKGISRLDWAWNNFDVNATAHYTDGFNEQIKSKSSDGVFKEHYVHQTWFFDVQASYDITFVAPVESQPVAGYSKDAKEVVRGKDGKVAETGQTANYSMPCWKTVLNNTKITVGCNNVFGQDPPKTFGFEFGNSTGYPGFSYDNLGRFVYVNLQKKF
jgi:iron complex outermembrane receptor protein